ncbi:hypothetical protein RUM43_000020 [Polyplax serrata]|uniref:DNA helicase MCM9 n=1 Tax=Polyplax serrata TaxID=468196 RepID=A0AAN8SC61_POLSC
MRFMIFVLLLDRAAIAVEYYRFNEPRAVFMDSELQETLRKFLIIRNKSELENVLANSDSNRNYSITVNFITLFEDNITIGNGLLIEPEKYLSAFNDAAISAQKHVLNEGAQNGNSQFCSIKQKVTVRIKSLPAFSEATFPCNKDIGFFVRINGTLIKAGPPKVLEHQRDYICLKCKHIVTQKACYEKYYMIAAPSKCDECHSSSIKVKNDIDVLNFLDYQEIKVQQHFGKSKVGTVPRSISVTLEGDLVDSCKPGDDVNVTGVLLRRWRPMKPGVRYDIELVLKANNIDVCNDQKSIISNKEVRDSFTNYWQKYNNQELHGRNHILKSFCPQQIFGLHLAKLAMVTVLAGGVQKTDDNDSSARGMSHLLLVGDAGTGKSHLLRYASRISNHSVFTTGVGSTTAGLTVTAIRECGDWNLEAGALVLADGGLCCIDDFNSIREHDRTSIHEAMEQQSISVAKAGIVTKLRTRCSIFATTSIKGGKYDSKLPMSVNVAISSPLLSRFDIVLVLLDSKSPEWDRSLCNFMFEKRTKNSQEHCNRGNTLIESTWTTTDIQKYFSVIKGLNPIMTIEAGTVLRAYYQFQRMADSRNVARTTVRLLESLIRLSQGHARLMFREKVTVLDAITAITIIESSTLNDFDGSQVNALHTTASDDPYEEYQSQARQILTKLKLFRILDDEIQRLDKMTSVAVEEMKQMRDGEESKEVLTSTYQSTPRQTSTVFKGENTRVGKMSPIKGRQTKSIFQSSKTFCFNSSKQNKKGTNELFQENTETKNSANLSDRSKPSTDKKNLPHFGDVQEGVKKCNECKRCKGNPFALAEDDDWNCLDF